MIIKRSYQVGPLNWEETGFFAHLFYCWALPMVVKLNEKEINVEEIPKNLRDDDSEKLGDELNNSWNKEVVKANLKPGENPSFRSALIGVFGKRIIMFGALAFIKDSILRIAQGILLGLLLKVPNKPDEADNKYNLSQLTISLLLIFVSGLHIILHHKYTFMAKHLGMKMRIGTSCLIYRKSLKVTQGALNSSGIGQISNFLANDVSRFDNAIEYLNYVWLSPVSISLTTVTIWYYVGYSSLSGVGLALLLLPLQGSLARLFGKIRTKLSAATDKRLKLLNEIISGILFIKISTYENPFSEFVRDARKKELNFIWQKAGLNAIMKTLLMVATRLIVFITLIVFILSGNVLDAEKVFVILTLYNNISQICTTLFPSGVIRRAELLAVIKRIEKFLLLEEKTLETEPDEDQSNVPAPKITVRNLSCRWDRNLSNPDILQDISFDLYPGKLLVVTGSVAAGKSTLVQAILGEIITTNGSIEKSGKIAYTSQDHWIFPGTVRENILFGLPFDPVRYNLALDACALQQDINGFDYRDFTLVGDKGATLSGGQKARISLARAIYQDADIYLLDDPLGSVDAKVAKHILENCIIGLLKSKSVILVAHQLQCIESADEIIILENGRVKARGGYNELISTNLLPKSSGEKVDNLDFESKKSVKVSQASKRNRKPLEHKEPQSSGAVGLKLFISYLKTGNGALMVLILLLCCILSQIIMSGCDLFLQIWTEAEEHSNAVNTLSSLNFTIGELIQNHPNWNSRAFYLYTYSAIIGLLLLMFFTRTITHYVLCLNSSKKLHYQMFNAIIHAPIQFFIENPSGSIMNRMAKDMGTIDETLPGTTYILIESFLSTLGSIVLVTIMNYYLFAPSLLLIIIFLSLRKFYIRASGQISRLEATNKSPVFSHLSSTLNGLLTVRAYRMEKNLQERFDKIQNTHTSVYYIYLGMSRWLGMTLQLLGFTYFTIVTLSFIFFWTDPSKVGLAISSALNISAVLSYLVSQSTDLENQLVSIERVNEYSNIVPEIEQTNENSVMPQTWPKLGRIEFDNVTVKYGTEQNILHKISFSIESKERIGIVGRTGAGKTSLINTLFRIVVPSCGTICIDGINIEQVNLKRLRSSISIIPQSPQLFTGTLRKNLDPFGQFDDNQMWNVLSQVQLEDKIRKLSEIGLELEIREGGTNFSHGERQLVCLARALLKQTKILVLDEATAHVDPETEHLIQETLRDRFKDCTVLTIAHRLETVVESDKILVLDSGRIVEYDKPYYLLQNSSSYFHNLVQQTGLEMFRKMYDIAQQAFEAESIR